MFTSNSNSSNINNCNWFFYNKSSQIPSFKWSKKISTYFFACLLILWKTCQSPAWDCCLLGKAQKDIFFSKLFDDDDDDANIFARLIHHQSNLSLRWTKKKKKSSFSNLWMTPNLAYTIHFFTSESTINFHKNKQVFMFVCTWKTPGKLKMSRNTRLHCKSSPYSFQNQIFNYIKLIIRYTSANQYLIH